MFTLKMNVLLIYLLGNPINVCWNPQNRAHFVDTVDLRDHMPRFTLKVNIFPYISWETSDMCVETLRTIAHFSKRIDLRGHMPRFTLKNEHFPIYLLEKPQISVCWNPQNIAHFFRDNQFEGSHAYVYSKNEWFPIYLLRNPRYVFETLRTVLNFLSWSLWRGTCLGLVEKWSFSQLCPWKHKKCVLKPSEQGSFCWDNWSKGVTCLGLL